MSSHRLKRLAAYILTTAAAMLLAATTAEAASPTPTKYTLFHSFNGANGAQPGSELTLTSDGSLWGSTTNDGPGGYGTIFRRTPTGRQITVHAFNGFDGWKPGALMVGRDGALYGTTSAGGQNALCTSGTCGTAFRLTRDGVLTTLHNFGGALDGAGPEGRLIQAKDGNFYGTTSRGGPADDGTVFRMTPEGIVTTLHTFDRHSINGFTGAWVRSGVTQASNGDLYGTTWIGGTNAGCTFSSGCGGVYRLSTDGRFKGAISFSDDDGVESYGSLLLASDGYLYGTTSSGGGMVCGGGNWCGTVFRVSESLRLTNIHRFEQSDGASPRAGLVQGPDGGLYGTTYWGGAAGAGTIFRIGLQGGITTQWTFRGAETGDGSGPQAGVVFDGARHLCGTTWAGGAAGLGSAYCF